MLGTVGRMAESDNCKVNGDINAKLDRVLVYCTIIECVAFFFYPPSLFFVLFINLISKNTKVIIVKQCSDTRKYVRQTRALEPNQT